MILTIVLCLNLHAVYSAPYNLLTCLEESDPFQPHLPEENGSEVIVEPSKVKFIIYQYPSKDPINITADNVTRLLEGFEIKILIPGWTEDINAYWLNKIRKTYLTMGKSNVIVFNWTEYAYYPYKDVSKLAKGCGEQLGKLLIFLGRNHKIKLEKVHLIGHSVGAHIAGFAGKEVQKHLGKAVGRITALDAAATEFEHALPEDRITRHDAKFVEGIHSNDRIFGMKRAFGTVDFFISAKDPFALGCSPPTKIRCYDIHKWINCKHNTMLQLWEMSIVWTNLTASGVVNKDTVPFGEHCPQNVTGLYNLVIDDMPLREMLQWKLHLDTSLSHGIQVSRTQTLSHNTHKEYPPPVKNISTPWHFELNYHFHIPLY